MARDVGTATLTTGTGTKVVTIGRQATDMRIVFKSPNILPAEGYIAGGFQYAFSDNANTADTAKCIKVKNNAGTTILEGTWTSFGTTTVTFNITTQSGTVPQMLLDFGY